MGLLCIYRCRERRGRCGNGDGLLMMDERRVSDGSGSVEGFLVMVDERDYEVHSDGGGG